MMKAKETKEEVSLNQHIEDLKERMKMLRKFEFLVLLLLISPPIIVLFM